MKYAKPSVAVSADALKAVQYGAGLGKPSNVLTDAMDPLLAMTNGAYEADE